MKRLKKQAEVKDLTKNEIFEILVEVLNGKATVLNHSDLVNEIKNEEDCKEISSYTNGFIYNSCKEAALGYLRAYYFDNSISFLQRCLDKGDFNYEKFLLNEIREDDNYTVIKTSNDYIFLQIG